MVVVIIFHGAPILIPGATAGATAGAAAISLRAIIIVP